MIHAMMELVDLIELYEAKLKNARDKELCSHEAGVLAREYGLVLEYLYEPRALRLEHEQLKEENKLLLENLGEHSNE